MERVMNPIHEESDGALALLLASCTSLAIDVCFANPGTTEMNIVAALDCLPHIRPVLCLQENVATGAADGFGRMKGRPALCLLHLGPGLTNGLANLHNSRRARSPVLVLVGGMASWHSSADPLLQMDMAALAATVSGIVIEFKPDPDSGTCRNKQQFTVHTEQIIKDSNVATILLPHDAAWGPGELLPVTQAMEAIRSSISCSIKAEDPKTALLGSTEFEFIKDCAVAMRQEQLAGGKVAMYLGGSALASEEALKWAGYISSITGAILLCEGAFPRIERGVGLPHLRRLPYFPQEAQQELQQYSLLVTVDARLPVANFGYKGGPSYLVDHLDASKVWEFDMVGVQHPLAAKEVLQLLGHQLGATPDTVYPGINCKGIFCNAQRPPVPSGKLTAQGICGVLASLQPEGVILVDESLTSGGSYWEQSKGCPRFSHLTLTGGAIGMGPALSVGVSVACPDRLVINLQADGSAMYTLQSLWTQAKEGLNVVTIICDNSAYSILKVECARQRLPPPGPATKALTQLSPPHIDWVHLGRGLGVPSHRASDCQTLHDLLQGAIKEWQNSLGDRKCGGGPVLIQACLI